MGQGPRVKRRDVIAASAGAALFSPLAGLTGCGRATAGPEYAGDWVGADHRRGHLVRDRGAPGQAAVKRRAAVVIIGGGVAGLACARALRRRGIDDVHLLELEDEAGGNARGHTLGAMACPLGAHYLPVPDPANHDLVECLAELELCQQQAGRWVYDEQHLCHSPQERLFMPDPSSDLHGDWIEGLLPPPAALPKDQRAASQADYRRFGSLVDREMKLRSFAIPTWQAGWSDRLQALDSQTFGAWLDHEGLHAPALRWYLDYCCRDDYGAGSGHVSAWAGLQYFASRHGFERFGGEADASVSSGVLTWPEGNAWLTRRLAKPLGDRLHSARTVVRIDESAHEVNIDAFDHRTTQLERWTARQVVVATPLFIAARLSSAPSAALQAAASALSYAPWLVANIQLDQALRDRPGAPPSWDNVVYASKSLGYVDAMHQSTRPRAGPTVLTAYWALGGDNIEQAREARQQLLERPWQSWSEQILAQLEPAHVDLRGKVSRIDLMRYGHAMAVPRPGTRGHPALRALAEQAGRVSFAHSDLSAYSIFEEAFFHGHRVGSSLRV